MLHPMNLEVARVAASVARKGKKDADCFYVYMWRLYMSASSSWKLTSLSESCQADCKTIIYIYIIHQCNVRWITQLASAPSGPSAPNDIQVAPPANYQFTQTPVYIIYIYI